MDRYDISAELRRRGCNQNAIAKKLGFSSTFISWVVSGKRRNRAVRREIARVLGKRVSEVWPTPYRRQEK